MSRWIVMACLACTPKPTVSPVEAPMPEALGTIVGPLSEVQALYDAGSVDEARARWFGLDEATRATTEGQALDRRFARRGAAFSGRELALVDWTPAPPARTAELMVLGVWEVGEPGHREALAKLQALHERFAPLGVGVAAVTRALDGATAADIASALEASAPTLPATIDRAWLVTAPLLLQRDDRSEAVLVYRSEVVWSGRIERLDGERVERWRGSSDGDGPTPPTELPADELAASMALGERVYHRSSVPCATCHLANGQGVPGAFPPLVGADAYLGDCARAASIVLFGLKGPIEVGGATYESVMPPMHMLLDDVQIASVLTYTRNSWGNDHGPCLPSEVAAVRAAGPP